MVYGCRRKPLLSCRRGSVSVRRRALQVVPVLCTSLAGSAATFWRGSDSVDRQKLPAISESGLQCMSSETDEPSVRRTREVVDCT